jgi:hypothetical protein
MVRRKQHKPRPFEIVMDEAPGDTFPWDLDEHLNGCLAGYQIASSHIELRYSAAVFFALEALWGIAHDVDIRAKTGRVDPAQLDDDWILRPSQALPVPWIWIRALSAAWEKYKAEGGPLGQAFGLEGGQGKFPAIAKLMQMLDERAIARWIWSRVREDRAAGNKIRIEDAIQEAAEKFNKSDSTIRRAWQRFGRLERLRCKE